MNKLKFLLLVATMLQIYSCKCDKTYDCGSLSNDALSWLNQNQNDTIKFINSIGQHYTFIVTARVISPPYEAQACKHGEIGCSCDYRCESNGRFWAESDVALNNLTNYSVDIEEGSNNNQNMSSILTYNIFDFIKQIDLLHPTNLQPGDSLIPSLQLGNTNYTSVYVMMLDTMAINYQNKKVWKTYFTKSSGVVGFIDRESQTLYLRE